MKKLIIALTLTSLLAAGLATAQSRLKIHLDDSGMNYAAVDKDNYGVNVSEKRMRDTAYLKLGYKDHILSVFLSSQPQPDALLTLSIADIPRYLSFGGNSDAASMRNARDSRYTSNKVATIRDIPEISFARYATSVNHVKIVHHDHTLQTLVETYDNALAALGFSRVEETNRRNGGIYLYQNGSDSLKLTFHREGDGVTMWMRSL